MKKYTLLFLFASMMTFAISCGDDDNDSPSGCTQNFLNDYQTEIDNINAASTTWAMDPSEANCNALKDAYDDYFDALENWEDCANFYNQVTEWPLVVYFFMRSNG